MIRIIDCAEEYGLVTITHAGYDIGFPGEEQSLPVHICNMLDEIKPSRMVLAHMGGWGCWDQVMDRIIGRDVYLLLFQRLQHPVRARHCPRICSR